MNCMAFKIGTEKILPLKSLMKISFVFIFVENEGKKYYKLGAMSVSDSSPTPTGLSHIKRTWWCLLCDRLQDDCDDLTCVNPPDMVEEVVQHIQHVWWHIVEGYGRVAAAHCPVWLEVRWWWGTGGPYLCVLIVGVVFIIFLPSI